MFILYPYLIIQMISVIVICLQVVLTSIIVLHHQVLETIVNRVSYPSLDLLMGSITFVSFYLFLKHACKDNSNHQLLINSSQNEDRLRDALRFANACGALTVKERGAIPALPTRETVLNALLKSVA